MHIADNLVDFGAWPSALIENVLHPFITVILCLLSVFVVLGNLLVVSAIWHENQLHSVTNYLIASLAAADCLVGAVVMPFSIISEIIVGSWTFGPTWCDLWHSFDVLASTASIMNLCAISLDRYLAITNPISYPTKMTPKRVALLIVSLWTCSSLISFPAIMWWRAVGQGPLQQITPLPQLLPSSLATTISPFDNTSNDFMTIQSDHQVEPLYRCVFTDDTYYLLFSSIVSFYGPLCVMLYAYYRIYKAAVQQTRFLKSGSKQVMIGGNKKSKRFRNFSEHSNCGTSEKYGLSEATYDGTSNMDSQERQHLVLRVHRGGGGNSNNSTTSNNNTVTNSTANKTNNGDINYSSRGDQKRLDNQQHRQQQGDLSAFKLSLEDSDTKKGDTFSSGGDADQSNLSSGERLQKITSHDGIPLECGGPTNAGLTRKNLIGLTRSKRDKLRVDRQRFDSSPIEENKTTTAESSSNNNNNDNNNNVKLITSGSNVRNKLKNNNQIRGRATADEKLSQVFETGKRPPSSMMKSNHTHSKQGRSPTASTSNGKASFFATTKITTSALNNQQQQTTKSSTDVPIFNHHSETQEKTSNFSALHGSSAPSFPHGETSTISNTGNVVTSQQHQRQYNNGKELEISSNCSYEIGNCEGSPEKRGASIGGLETINDDDEIPDNEDVFETESTSGTSSLSYGTGSIVSVLVRPQSIHTSSRGREHGEKSHLERSCDTIDSHLSNPKLRRALSVGDAENKGPKMGPRWNNAGTENNNNEHGKAFPLVQNSSMAITMTTSMGHNGSCAILSKHRASCGNTFRGHSPSEFTPTASGSLGASGTRAGIGGGFKTAKTLDIRSWVKLARTRSHKNDDTNQPEGSWMKPPPSLMPLMMMNSDTSTDSSIAACPIGIDSRRLDGMHEEDEDDEDELENRGSVGSDGNEKRKKVPENSVSRGNPICTSSCDTISFRATHTNETSTSLPSSMRSYRKPSSIEMHYHHHQHHHNQDRGLLRNHRRSNQLERNLSFKEDLERGDAGGKSKGQMLYYDSDKLIQSIVDLTALHYIDCAGNQTTAGATQDGTLTMCALGGAAAGGTIANEVERADSAHHNQIPDANRVSVPRQQRSMGKKLTKLAKERKAAKTLGIVVGVFILCWLPFFVVNILVALCGTGCIYKPQILNSIVTWLGWLNSAMNPVIYACWSRDFRRAFRRVLCSWVEFLCPYDGSRLAKKLKLKKRSNYAQETYLNRTASSMLKGNSGTTTAIAAVTNNNTSSTTTNKSYIEGVSRTLLSDQ